MRPLLPVIAALGIATSCAAQAQFLSPLAPAPPNLVMAKAAPALKGSPIYHLSADQRQLRFEGETVSRVWPIFVTHARATSRARLRLVYTNAVSVMPEASTLTLSVNDVVVKQAKISAPGDAETLDVELPDGLLQPGYNALRISVQQRHRVDCSIGATYELWTQVQPAGTGLVFPAVQDAITDLADLPAMIADQDGAQHIRAVLPRGADATAIDRMLRAVQSVAIRGNFLRPSVDVAEAFGETPGVAVIVGTFDELHARGFGALVKDGQPVTVVAGMKPGQTTIVVAGQTLNDLDNAIDALLPEKAAEAPGTAAGTTAAVWAAGRRITMNGATPFSKLDAGSQEFNGRFFRTGFDIVLPPDFYSADYGKATLRIDAGYAAGLDPTSQIIVRVNDRDASSLPLPDPKGDVFRKRPINISLADLRPGFNHVQIEAEVNNGADAVCDPLKAADAGKRFVLLEQSELVMPRVARIAHLPSLSATSASGFPYVERAAPARVLLARQDSPTIAAAATFLARAAVSAGQPLDTMVVNSARDIEGASALIFGGLNDLSPALVETLGLDHAALRKSWAAATLEAQAKPARAPDPAAKETQAHAPAPGYNPAGAAPRGSRSGDLYDQWSQKIKTDKSDFDLMGAVSGWLEGFFGTSRLQTPFWRNDNAMVMLPASARLIVAQHAAPGVSETWTLITAPTPDILARETANIVAPSNWRQLDGSVAAYDPATDTVTVAPTGRG